MARNNADGLFFDGELGGKHMQYGLIGLTLPGLGGDGDG